MKRKIVALICVLANLVTVTHAAEMGVCSLVNYQGNADRIMKLADGVGAEWVRDGYNWEFLEKEKGVLSAENVSDKLLPETAKAHGKKLQMVLGFGNPVYNKLFQTSRVIMPEKSNQTYFNAWLNYARFVANRWGDSIDAYSIWNEPNLRAFNKYEVGGDVYAELVKATYPVLKEIDPDAIVTAGALSTSGADYLDEMLAAGAGDYMDVLTIHTYRHETNGPEVDFRTAWDGFEAVLDKYNFNKDIWLDETGWYTGTAENAKTEEQQAAYAVRSAVLWEDYLKDNNREGHIMWYSLSDSGSDKTDKEQNFGLANSDLVPKKSYNSVKTYNKLMKNLDFESLDNTGTLYNAKYLNSDTNNAAYVLWSTSDTAEKVTIDLSGDKVYVYNYTGNLIEEIENPSGTKTLSVTGEPTYVVCSNNVTQIKSTGYDADKNILTVKGESGAENVTVRIIKDGAVNTEMTRKVKDGKFTAEISPKIFGTVTVAVIPDEGTGEDRELTINPTVDPNGRNIGFSEFRAGYVVENKTATITCKTDVDLENEELTILVTKKGADVDSLTKEQIVHVGQTNVNGTEFTYNFDVTEDVAGVYQVFVGGSFAQNASEKLISPYAQVGAFTISVESGSVEVKVEADNENYYAKSFDLYIAQYDANGRLVAVDVIKDSVSANGDLAKSYNMSDIIKSDTVKVKAFIWDSVNLYPLHQAAE